MKNINITLIGVSLMALTFSFKVNAQSCTTPPTCAELGYTKSSSDCATSSLKCPFDQSKYFCLTAGEIADLTPSKCTIGDILYSDKSCNANVVASKTAIGVVFDTTNRLAIAKDSVSKAWMASPYEDVTTLTNITSSSAVTADWQGKNNTAIILKYCQDNSKTCPAFEYVNTYSTTGTKAGDWYLPAMGELNAIYGNKGVLNTTLSKIGGTALPNSYHWSSSEYPNSYAWRQDLTGGTIHGGHKDGSNYVRPVLAF